MSDTFPPARPTTMAGVIPAYVYQEYQDDQNIQSFVTAYNVMAQWFVDFFNGINLPYYPQHRGALLDWVGRGLYFIPRPTFSIVTVTEVGGYNTVAYNVLAYNEAKPVTQTTYAPVNDDIYCRILTWHTYKGDGPQYSTQWLKARIHRFLNGPYGVLAVNDNTDDVSVRYSGNGVTITLAASPIAQAFQLAVADGFLALPLEYNFTVNLFGTTGTVAARLAGAGRVRASAVAVQRAGARVAGSGGVRAVGA